MMFSWCSFLHVLIQMCASGGMSPTTCADTFSADSCSRGHGSPRSSNCACCMDTAVPRFDRRGRIWRFVGLSRPIRPTAPTYSGWAKAIRVGKARAGVVPGKTAPLVRSPAGCTIVAVCVTAPDRRWPPRPTPRRRPARPAPPEDRPATPARPLHRAVRTRHRIARCPHRLDARRARQGRRAVAAGSRRDWAAYAAEVSRRPGETAPRQRNPVGWSGVLAILLP